jgi:hypothetical protein
MAQGKSGRREDGVLHSITPASSVTALPNLLNCPRDNIGNFPCETVTLMVAIGPMGARKSDKLFDF